MKKRKKTIHVLGLNSFDFEDLSHNKKELFYKIENIAVPKTYFKEIRNMFRSKSCGDKNFFISKSDNNLIDWIKSLDNDVVLISRGDPLWYGIGRILLKNFSQKDLLFYPAHTCVQLAFNKLKKSWQNAKTVSIHGRDSNELIKLLKSKEKSIAILTDPNNKSFEIIRANLKELNLENFYDFWLFEELGFEKERITLIKNNDHLPIQISSLNIVILLKKEIVYKNSSLPLFGIDDNYYETFTDRPNLITKRDIRVQVLADLELPEFGNLIDIGSGCGTIGLEALRIRPNLKLICIDKRLGSKSLITENAKRLEVSPIQIIEDDVRNYLLNKFRDFVTYSNRIIIGGCDKETKTQIIREISKLLHKGDIFVIPVVTYEVLQQTIFVLREFNYITSVKLIQSYVGLSILEGTRFEPHNPVFIIKAIKE